MQLESRRVRGLLIDLDGVLHVGREALPGACEKVAELEASGLPHLYVTNTTTRPVAALAAELGELGFAIDAGAILSAPMAARRYLESLGSPCCKLLLREEVLAEFDDFPQSDTAAEVVLVGDIGDAWSYPLLNQAFGLLMNGARLVALHRNKYWQTSTGLQLDIGAFVAGLEYATGQSATVVGKPQREFFAAALARLGVEAADAAMIGDDVESDVGGAQALGLTGILVRTGKYREDQVRRSGVTPDRILDSFADLELD